MSTPHAKRIELRDHVKLPERHRRAFMQFLFAAALRRIDFIRATMQIRSAEYLVET
ncbi:hypothetical protein FHX09_001558 [Rhizobium sp. BK538]|nr:hypothetical protein [Rhizobium sp. BK060]MBB4167727.1 hypothetical protein [Rhizobium sp. BK538]TCM64398.1 hypothetical protein EV291_1463 [Rhizobium sp. BK068]